MNGKLVWHHVALLAAMGLVIVPALVCRLVQVGALHRSDVPETLLFWVVLIAWPAMFMASVVWLVTEVNRRPFLKTRLLAGAGLMVLIGLIFLRDTVNFILRYISG